MTNPVSVRRTALRVDAGKIAFWGIGVAFLTVLVVFPLASMFQYVSGNGIGVFWRSITSPGAVFSLKFTVILVVATTLINAAMGTVLAFMLVRHDFPGKGVFDSLVDLPIAIPAAVTGFTLLLYGPLGILGELSTVTGMNIMFVFSGVLIAHVFMTLPHVVRAVGPVLSEIDRSQEEAAKNLGASGPQVFVGVILPSIKGAMISGSVFTFARSLGELGATIIVSGNLALRTQTEPMFIFSGFDRGDIEAASSISVVLVVISLVLLLGLKLAVKMTAQGGTKRAKRDHS